MKATVHGPVAAGMQGLTAEMVWRSGGRESQKEMEARKEEEGDMVKM